MTTASEGQYDKASLNFLPVVHFSDSLEKEHPGAERERQKWVVNAGSVEEGIVEMPTKSCMRLLNQSRSLSVSHF